MFVCPEPSRSADLPAGAGLDPDKVKELLSNFTDADGNIDWQARSTRPKRWASTRTRSSRWSPDPADAVGGVRVASSVPDSAAFSA
jgi:hypothetical protein